MNIDYMNKEYKILSTRSTKENFSRAVVDLAV